MKPVTSIAIIVIGLLAATMGHPLQSPSQASLSSNFTLTMSYNNNNLSLVAIDNTTTTNNNNNTSDTLNIIGLNARLFSGTPVEAIGDGSNGQATLSFNIGTGDDCTTTNQTSIFGIFAPDLGERYGASIPLSAVRGYRWPHWYVGSQTILPQLTAASQGFYACNISIRGKEMVGLSWGVYNSNGSAPFGCESTTVYQQ